MAAVKSKEFNVEGLCLSEYHYMVDIEENIVQIETLIEKGKYFVINRARQYGKTTTLHELKNKLDRCYSIFSISFEGLESEVFSSTASFCSRFIHLVYDTIKYHEVNHISEEIKNMIHKYKTENYQNMNLHSISELIIHICEQADKPIILIIDEVDQASNHKIFLDFLGQLRNMYLNRFKRSTFHSVILAGVRDIKNLKHQIDLEGNEVLNSPWNIAAEFNIDMSLSVSGIASMLKNYEQDHKTSMNVQKIAQDIYDYTSGYPFLVSRICKLMDEQIKSDAKWSHSAFLEAVRFILIEENTLFQSLDNKLSDYKELKQILKELLFQGKMIEYIPSDQGIREAVMYGFVVNKNGILEVANRIFEIRLYNLFLAEQSRGSQLTQMAVHEKSQFITNGHLDMEQIIHRFVHHYSELFGDYNTKFLEDDGRKLFLLFIKPIINGKGNYYIEAQIRTNSRTDIIIDYLGQQYIIELKLWHGKEYNQRGEEQILNYLNQYQLMRGYMISFDFNKKKKIGVKKIMIGDKVLIEAVV